MSLGEGHLGSAVGINGTGEKDRGLDHTAEVVTCGTVGGGGTGRVFEDTASRRNKRGRDDVPGFV